ncbi:GRAM domain-containing protein 2B-like isoform X2 [Betta splendens]|uniref:GRAM domain-containing protein 2B-like isoform X2 n=1 Tax=Betta splendens TaxID=158456 RepID=A0A6P7KZS2_BETSP|nr:GRAM domain-containing protein 2B-like isoform X2 [Betta splendens]
MYSSSFCSMSFKNRKFSLDSSFSADGDGVLVVRKSSSSRFSGKKPKPSLDDARAEIQELHRDLNANVSQRKPAAAEDGPERSDELISSHSFQKLNKSFHKLFPDIPEGESLIQSFTFALQKEILYHGKLFVSENHVCFHSSVLLRDTKAAIPVSSITEVKKHNAALSMLTIHTASEKFSFVSLRNRDLCYKLLRSVCSHAQRERPGSGGRQTPTAEDDAGGDVAFSSSSLDDNTDQDLSKQQGFHLDNGFAHVPGRGPTRYDSSVTDDGRATVSWLQSFIETVADFEHMSMFFYIYVMLMVVLVLVSGYIGLRIVALEEQLNSLGALTELSLQYREHQET